MRHHLFIFTRWFIIALGVLLIAWGGGIYLFGDQPEMAIPIQVAADIQAVFQDPNDSYLLSIAQVQPVDSATGNTSGSPAEVSSGNSNPSSQVFAPEVKENLKPERLVIPDIQL